MSLGDNVRWRRTQLGLTQTQLAAHIRIVGHKPTPSYISRIESGRIDPRLSTVRALARALKCPVWWLTSDTVEARPVLVLYDQLSASQKREVRRMIKWMIEGGHT